MLFPNEIYIGRRLFSLVVKEIHKYTIICICDCGKKVTYPTTAIILEKHKDCGCGEGDVIHKCTPQSGYKPLITPCGRFRNPKEAAEAHCLALATITRRCNSPQWGAWQWTCNLAKALPAQKYDKREIVTPVGKFRSITECAEANNISTGAVKYRLNSLNFPEWERK